LKQRRKQTGGCNVRFKVAGFDNGGRGQKAENASSLSNVEKAGK
jgi:hypothetical protein